MALAFHRPRSSVRSASYPLDAIIKGTPTNPSSLQIVKVSLFGVVRRYS